MIYGGSSLEGQVQVPGHWSPGNIWKVIELIINQRIANKVSFHDALNGS